MNMISIWYQPKPLYVAVYVFCPWNFLIQRETFHALARPVSGASVSERSTGVAQRRNTSAAMKAGVPHDSHDFVAERLSCALPHFSYQMLHHSIQRLHQVLENHWHRRWSWSFEGYCSPGSTDFTSNWFLSFEKFTPGFFSNFKFCFVSSKRMGHARPKSASLATPLASTPLVISETDISNLKPNGQQNIGKKSKQWEEKHHKHQARTFSGLRSRKTISCKRCYDLERKLPEEAVSQRN